MGWLRLVGFFKLQVSFAKEPYKRDLYSAKWLIILRSLLTVATPYIYPFYQPHSLSSQCFSDVRTMAQHACGVQYIWYFFPVFFSIRCISAHNHCMSLWHCSTTACITSARNSSKVSSTFCMVLADFWETIPQKSAVHFVWYFESQLYICMVFHHCICMILHHILYGISIVSSTFVWYFMTVVNFWQQLVHTLPMIHMTHVYTSRADFRSTIQNVQLTFEEFLTFDDICRFRKSALHLYVISWLLSISARSWCVSLQRCSSTARAIFDRNLSKVSSTFCWCIYLLAYFFFWWIPASNCCVSPRHCRSTARAVFGVRTPSTSGPSGSPQLPLT